MRKLIYLLSLLIFNNCRGQITNNQNSTMNTTEKFDIDKFNKLEKDNNYSSTKEDLFFKSNDKKYRILLDNEIQVEETDINSPYMIYKVYFKKSRQLKAICKKFYGIPIGIDKLYDEAGNLIKETNNDLPYKFSIEDLATKMKNEYNIDTYNQKQVFTILRTYRDTSLSFPYYEIIIHNGIASYKHYLINATTGQTIFVLNMIRGEDKLLVDEYLKSLKK